MTRKNCDQRIRQLEDALLEYVVRYGPTTAALEAFKTDDRDAIDLSDGAVVSRQVRF